MPVVKNYKDANAPGEGSRYLPADSTLNNQSSKEGIPAEFIFNSIPIENYSLLEESICPGGNIRVGRKIFTIPGSIIKARVHVSCLI